MRIAVLFILSLLISITFGALVGFGVSRIICDSGVIIDAKLIVQIICVLIGIGFGYDIFTRVTLAIHYKPDDPNPIVRDLAIPKFSFVTGAAWGIRRGWLVALPVGIGAVIGYLIIDKVAGSNIIFRVVGLVSGALIAWVTVICVGAIIGWMIGIIFLISPSQRK